jgi:hypothetical protein
VRATDPPKWRDERAVEALVFAWLDAEEGDTVAREATIVDPPVRHPPTATQLAAMLRSGKPLSAKTRALIADMLDRPSAPPKRAPRKRGRPKTDTSADVRQDAEAMARRIADFLRQRYPRERFVTERAVQITVARFKMYYEPAGLPERLKLTARKLRNFMARPAHDRRRG